MTAPDWAKEGDSIEIEANKKRYIVAVPAGTIKGHAFNVAVPGLNQSAGELRAGLPCPVRVCCIGCSTVWLVVVWGAVAFSYLVLIFWREVRWNATTLLVAHAILGLQIVSYVRCQVTPPGTVTKEWQHQAASGLEPSESCKRSGLLQPARGVFVSHEGKVVLGLDHYCFWLGTTIGFRNRKYFLLFLLYSCGLALFAGSHALHELLVGLPGRLPASVVGVEQDALWQRVLGGDGPGPRFPMPLQLTHGTPLLLLQVVASTFGGGSRMRVGYCVAIMLVCVLDFVMAMLLALFGGWHVWLVLRNRTTFAPHERRYDVGVVANVRQVMGRHAALWLLPIEGAGPTVDGIHWPLSRDAAKHEREAGEAANDSEVGCLPPAGGSSKDRAL